MVHPIPEHQLVGLKQPGSPFQLGLPDSLMQPIVYDAPDPFFKLAGSRTGEQVKEEVRRVIDDGLHHGVGEAQLKRAARLLQSYELMFWDGVYQASTAQ